MARRGEARFGMAGKARLGKLWQVEERLGAAGKAG